MRRCFLHVGTHKTGTKSIQAFLAGNRDALLAAGIIVPTLGRPVLGGARFDGHHNVAWELNADPRFDAEHGNSEQLLREIAESRTLAAVVSSEDFEYLCTRPAVLSKLASDLRGIGYEPKIVVYLRNRSEYAKSLYAELVKHGLRRGFGEFLSESAASGAFAFRDNWVFSFRYSRLLDAFADAFGRQALVVHLYHGDCAEDALLSDFASIITSGSDRVDVGRMERPGRLNQACSFIDVLGQLRRNVVAEGQTQPDPAALAAELFPDAEPSYLTRPFDVMGSDDAQRFDGLFEEDDRAMAERYRIRIPASSRGDACDDELYRRRQRLLLQSATKRWNLDV